MRLYRMNSMQAIKSYTIYLYVSVFSLAFVHKWKGNSEHVIELSYSPISGVSLFCWLLCLLLEWPLKRVERNVPNRLLLTRARVCTVHIAADLIS